MPTENKRIGISFSGGGARAIAHIGVIKALNRYGIFADEIAGTSGGSIIAALYAAGISSTQMIEIAKEASLLKIFKPGLPIMGLTNLNYLEEILDKHISYNDFSELAIPLYITVSNLISGEKEILSTGDFKTAVKASCTIPLLFKPVENNEQLYVDGGIFDNMPVVSLQENCDLILGVNVMPNILTPESKIDDMFSIGMRVFDMAISENSIANYSICDHVIEPKEIVNYSIFDFKKVDELIQLGYIEAMKSMPELVSKIQACRN